MILVTGANGFIGQHLVPLLLREFPKEKIVAAVGKTKKLHEQEGLKILKKLSVKIIKIDLCQKNSLKKLPTNPKMLIHLASAVDTGESDFRANDVGTNNLLIALNKISKKNQVVYTSTAAVWSGRKIFPSLNEKVIPAPNNEYGKTKLIGEQSLIENSHKKGFGLTILRLNTVYGRDLRQDKLFGMVQKLIEKRSFITSLNWPGQFGIVHVDDVVKAIIQSLKYPAQPSQTRMYIVSTENITLPLISKYIHQALHLDYKPVNLPSWLWQGIALCRYLTSITEKILPARLYNLLWRVTLITNDVLKADGSKIKKELPRWTRRKFKDYFKEVIIHNEEK